MLELADYEQQVTDFQTSLEPSPESLTVSVVLSGPFGFIAHTPKSFSGSVLKEIGFQRNAAQGNDEQFFVRLCYILSTDNGYQFKPKNPG